MMEANYTDDIQRFSVDNFKVVKACDPWMYDPLGVFIQEVHKNKKCLIFKHFDCTLNVILVILRVKLTGPRHGILFHYRDIEWMSMGKRNPNCGRQSGKNLIYH